MKKILLKLASLIFSKFGKLLEIKVGEPFIVNGHTMCVSSISTYFDRKQYSVEVKLDSYNI